MKEETKQRKNAMPALKQWSQQTQVGQQLYEIVQTGSQALNELSLQLGREIAEFILYSEREELAGPDYQPRQEGLYKWASQPGSVYLAGQKIKVQRPRLRQVREVRLQSYQAMKKPQGFSEQLLAQSLAGLSGRQYRQTLVNAAEAFGVSPSAVSKHLIEITTEKLKEFKERALHDFIPLALFIDTVHRGGMAFVVALGLDLYGHKQVLGFWQGATECAEVADSLLGDLQARGLKLSAKVLFIVDGGKGLSKALSQRYTDKLLLQRCTIHKERNLQGHLPKKYRSECHHRYRVALEQNDYKEAERMLRELEQWLRTINESAADSLSEAFNELLTLHRLKVPGLLRKTLHSTNPIESLFSQVRACEKNIKRYRDSNMAQRWLASVLLHAENSFRKIKGHEHIPKLVAFIEARQ